MSLNAIADAGTDEARAKQTSESRKMLVRDLCTRVKDAKTFWKPTFERIRDNIKFAGGDQWQDAEEKMADSASDKFQVNFVQRELNQQVSAIYARNPDVTCERRKRMEYTVWDGTEQSLMQAQLILQQNAPAMAAAGQAQGALQQEQQQPGTVPPEVIAQAQAIVNAMPPEVRQAQALVKDYMAGVARKALMDKVAETAELLFNEELDLQEPDFETQMKDLVLREKTTGAGFVAIKFQRQNESLPASSALRADVVNRLQRIQQMAEEQSEDELTEAEKEEFQLELAALQMAMQQQNGPVKAEGLVLDFKPTTSVIVDPKCRSLFKFVAANWVAEELMMSPEAIEAQWGVDVKEQAASYMHGEANQQQTNLNTKAGGSSDRDNKVSGTWPEKAECAVWIIYDKLTQLKYTVCDGCEDFLEEPEAPWPAVRGFWPIVALKLSRIEIEENNPKAGLTIYGESAVQLMKPMQEEMNRSQEGKREHRIANKPGHVCPKDAFDENDRKALAGRTAHEVIPLNNLPPGTDIRTVLMPVPNIPIQEELYDTSSVMQQVMLVTGLQQANMGAQASGEKATGQAIAEQSRIIGVSSEVDSLDKFLSEVARIGGEMLFAEMSVDTVKQLVGPGAAWANDPAIRKEINNTMFLKIKAGSMGRPNRAMEVANLQQMLPQMAQLAMAKGLPMDPLIKYAAKVLEFDFDVDEWLAQAQPPMAPAQPGGAPPPQQQQQSAANPNTPGGTQPGSGMVGTMLRKAQNTVAQ